MSNFLTEMAKESAQRAEVLPTAYPASQFDKPVHPLRMQSFDLIAEIKNRSPAEGLLESDGDSRSARALNYVRGGAAAISVLTEPKRFDGDIAHLDEVVNAVSDSGVPVMRKDFLVDIAQVLEAKAAGASGVLLIAAILDDRKLADMLDCAFEHQLFVLLEAFDETDMKRAADLVQDAKVSDQAARNKFMVGVNTRDLRTLEVDTTRLRRFAPLLPAGVTAVAESGLTTADDATNVVGWGYRAALVGTALMRSDKPERLIADMLASGREEVAA